MSPPPLIGFDRPPLVGFNMRIPTYKIHHVDEPKKIMKINQFDWWRYKDKGYRIVGEQRSDMSAEAEKFHSKQSLAETKRAAQPGTAASKDAQNAQKTGALTPTDETAKAIAETAVDAEAPPMPTGAANVDADENSSDGEADIPRGGSKTQAKAKAKGKSRSK